MDNFEEWLWITFRGLDRRVNLPNFLQIVDNFFGPILALQQSFMGAHPQIVDKAVESFGESFRTKIEQKRVGVDNLQAHPQIVDKAVESFGEILWITSCATARRAFFGVTFGKLSTDFPQSYPQVEAFFDTCFRSRSVGMRAGVSWIFAFAACLLRGEVIHLSTLLLLRLLIYIF